MPPAVLRYRPALDGLRAIAVLAVFVYHAHESWLPGGWFGVDIFFVLSGFLITSLLLREHGEWGRISLLHFWRNRARRLFPALALMLAAVLVAASLWTLPTRRPAVGADALSAMFYVANWRFLLSDDAYFATLAAPSPLRHTWSLAVEEQYYLAFPLLLGVILLLSRRRAVVAASLAALTLLSAWWMAHLFVPGLDPSRVYYGTDARAFELFTGAILAALTVPGPFAVSATSRDRLDRVCRALAPLALLATLVLTYRATALQDGLLAGWMLPTVVIVAVVVVAAASPRASLVQRALSWEPLRRVGVISYGLYLWHWPIIVFLTPDRVGLSGLPLFLLHAALTWGTAWTSYRYVEEPIRRRGFTALLPHRRGLSRAIGLGTAPVLIAGALLMPSLAGSATATPADGGGAYTLEHAAYVPPQGEVKATFVGNSIPLSMYQTYPQGSFPGLVVGNATNIGCSPYDAPKVVSGKESPVTAECAAWRTEWPQEVAAAQTNLAVLWVTQASLAKHRIGGAVVGLGDPAFDGWIRGQWSAMAQAARGAGARRVAFVNLACHDVPDFGTDDEIARLNDDALVQRLNGLLRQWADDESAGGGGGAGGGGAGGGGGGGGVPIIDQYSALCTGGFHAVVSGATLYSDFFHFTPQSGPIVWAWLAPQLVEIAERP